MIAPLFDLAGRTALVTDTAAGVGLLVARALADAGARVVVNSQDIYTAEETLQRIGAYRARTCCFDVADDVAVVRSIDTLEAARWRVDILVNNRGTAAAVTSVSRAVAERMIARGSGGKIINIDPVASGDAGLPDVLTAGWAQKGICVNALSPGHLHSDGAAEVLQRQVVFLASSAADDVVGQTLFVDAGAVVLT